MKIYSSVNEIPPTKKGILTIGTFDGIHVGHRKIIEKLKIDQGSEGGETFVITFKNHPFDVLHPKKVPKRLATLDFKVNYLKSLNINYLILIDFTKEFANIIHKDFFYLLLSLFESLKMVVGCNFRFGKGNLGNIDYLKSFVEDRKFSLDIVEKFFHKDHAVSSSNIRQFIRRGQLEIANEMLAREYYIEGKVIHGNKLGRNIGYPTINIINNYQIYPMNGVYKSKVEINGDTYSAMTFVGKKSLDSNSTEDEVIESHIFNFNKEIYDQEVRIYFQKRIRDEMRFDSLDGLKVQLKKDEEMIISIDNSILSYPD